MCHLNVKFISRHLLTLQELTNQRSLGFQVYLTKKAWIHEEITSRLHKSWIYYKFFALWFFKNKTKQKAHRLYEAREKDQLWYLPTSLKIVWEHRFLLFIHWKLNSKKHNLPLLSLWKFLKMMFTYKQWNKGFPTTFQHTKQEKTCN